MAHQSTADAIIAVLKNRPADEELDLFGVTHPGKVRPDNQDQFLMCTVHPQVVIHGTSVPDPETLPLRGTRMATMLVVADGVGGAASGSDAARVATETLTRYVSSTLRSYHAAGSETEEVFLTALRAAALEAHDSVRAEAATRTDQRMMATTLTVNITVWPWSYFIQVGDSRGYVFTNGALRQITRDQTLGQDLVDLGALPPRELEKSPLRNVLSSAIGAEEALPIVTRVDVRDRGTIVFLCSDGLTKHVNDTEIEAALRNRKSSEQVARDLLELALERGGSDNITIIVACAPVKPAARSAEA